LIKKQLRENRGCLLLYKRKLRNENGTKSIKDNIKNKEKSFSFQVIKKACKMYLYNVK